MTDNISTGKTTEHFNLNSISPEDLRPVFEKLTSVGYNERNIIRLLRVKDLNEIKFPAMPIYVSRYLWEDTPLNTAIKLFQLALQLPFGKVEKLFSGEEIETLTKVGVLAKTDRTYLSTVDIFPCLGSLIATDIRFSGNFHSDSVYYLGLDSYNLARGMVKEPVNSSLDLCTGGGVQAIVASRFSKEVTAVEVSSRALNFCCFNAMLNNCPDIEFLQGDLYEAVKGRKFDRIYVNPPFVPSPEREILYRDGSATGEDVLMRVLQGLPQYLNDGGLCQITTLLVLTGQDYNEKIASWITEGKYDILTPANNYQDVLPYIFSHMDFSLPFPEYSKKLLSWFDCYTQNGIAKLAEGLINIRPSTSEKPVYKMTELASYTTDFSEEMGKMINSL